jgi:hypothetical protein
MSSCELCARKGVLIYPVRYAIACPGGAAEAPGLSGNFKIEGAPMEVGKAKYTLRSMRQGYLYAFDEKRKALRAYVVTGQGQLWNFNTDFLPPQPETIKFGCTNQAEVAYSRCIDITHKAGDAATNIWIGWSSVVWTRALIAKVGDPAWRKKHMQCIDVAAMVAGTAPHTGEFGKDYEKIAHFSMSKDEMEKAFSFSNTSVVQEQSQAKLHQPIGLTMAVHGPYNKGFIVGLNDPVGITNDLSELTTPSVDAGFDEDIARGKMVYELLQKTEAGLREEAVQGVGKADAVAKHYAANPEKGGDMYNSTRNLWQMLKVGGFNAYDARVAADKKKYGVDLVARQRAAADHAWADITFDGPNPQLDQARINNFPALYASTMKAFEPEYEKIARTHLAWLTSEQLANWMDGVHDAGDLRSGYAYSESVLQCIGAGVSTGVCSEQLMVWLNSGKLSGNRNLYGRGLLFNQDTIVKMVEPHVNDRDFKLEEVLNVYKLRLESIEAGHARRLIDRLALGTANILVKGLRLASYSVARGMALAHMTMVGGTTIKASTMQATDLGRWILAQAEAQGIPMNVRDQKNKVAAYKEAKRILKANPADHGLIAYELDVAKLEADGRIAVGSMKAIKVPGFDVSKRWLGTSPDFGIGVVTTILQLVALHYLVEDVVESDPNNDFDRRNKLCIAIVGLTSGLIETICNTVAKAPTHPLAARLMTQWAVLTVAAAKKLAFGAKVAGAVAGFIAGVYEIYQGIKKARDGDLAMGTLLGISGVLGISVAVALFFGAAAFWPLLVLSFIMGFVVALLSNDELKEWISRCYFSTAATIIRATNKAKGEKAADPYKTASDELKAYKGAVGA